MKIIKASKGSGLDLQNAIEDKIAQLNDSGIMSASNVDDSARESYLHTLIGAVKAGLTENGIQDISFDQNGRYLYVIVNDTLEEYLVPLQDLSFDSDNIDEDEKYIIDGILSYCNEAENTETVLSYTEISDGDKSLLVNGLEMILEPECDDYTVKFNDDGVTVDVSVDDISKSWFFTYDELDLSKGTEQAVDYIANTVFSYLDDPAVEE